MVSAFPSPSSTPANLISPSVCTTQLVVEPGNLLWQWINASGDVWLSFSPFFLRGWWSGQTTGRWTHNWQVVSPNNCWSSVHISLLANCCFNWPLVTPFNLALRGLWLAKKHQIEHWIGRDCEFNCRPHRIPEICTGWQDRPRVTKCNWWMG